MLGNGSVLEFDSPQSLLSDENSQFSSLVRQAGSSEAEYLRMLVNVTKSNGKQTQEIVIHDDGNALEQDNETDPLLSSNKIVI